MVDVFSKAITAIKSNYLTYINFKGIITEDQLESIDLNHDCAFIYCDSGRFLFCSVIIKGTHVYVINPTIGWAIPRYMLCLHSWLVSHHYCIHISNRKVVHNNCLAAFACLYLLSNYNDCVRGYRPYTSFDILFDTIFPIHATAQDIEDCIINCLRCEFPIHIQPLLNQYLSVSHHIAP